jgi:plastocyanin
MTGGTSYSSEPSHGGLIALAVVSILAGCGDNPYGGGGGGCTPTATQVCMTGSQFNPTALTITAGTTVTWKNGATVGHTVTSATGSADTYDSNNLGANATFSHRFGTVGTYEYYCKIHGANGAPPTGMRGTITVN